MEELEALLALPAHAHVVELLGVCPLFFVSSEDALDNRSQDSYSSAQPSGHVSSSYHRMQENVKPLLEHEWPEYEVVDTVLPVSDNSINIFAESKSNSEPSSTVGHDTDSKQSSTRDSSSCTSDGRTSSVYTPLSNVSGDAGEPLYCIICLLVFLFVCASVCHVFCALNSSEIPSCNGSGMLSRPQLC